MTRRIITGFVPLALAITLTAIWPPLLRAEDAIEKAGVAIGVTVGNMVFIPAKAISTSMGLFFGVLSFVLTGGDTEVTHQMWRDSTADPYLINPAIARTAIGRRPELSEND
jgi:hypothetical protein